MALNQSVIIIYQKNDNYHTDEDSILVGILVEPPYLLTEVLDEYAKQYCFERKSIYGVVLDLIENPVK